MNQTALLACSCFVIKQSPLALAVTAGDKHLLHCVNTAFCQVTGIAVDHLLERSFARAFPGSSTNASLALLDRVWRTGKGERITEVEHHRPNRPSVFWNYTVWPVLGHGRRPAALFIEIRDASELVRTRHAASETADEMRNLNERLLVAGVHEQELAEDAERQSAELNALLKSMSDGVAVVDAEGRLVLMNDAGRQIFRVPAEVGVRAMEAQSGAGLQHLDGTPLSFEQWPLTRAQRGEQFDRNELVLLLPDGEKRQVVFSGSAIRDDTGQVSLAIVVFRDVTELREIEAMKDQLVSLVSHDLRAPLNAILGYADLLLEALESQGREKETRFAASIVRSVQTMDGMIQDLVESSRMESTTPHLNRRPCDLGRLVSQSLEQLVSPEQQKRVELVIKEPLPTIDADPARLDRALVNLVGNALKYSPGDAQVIVRVERRDHEEVVSVTDQGVGISAEDLPYVFDRFYRAKSGAKVKGSGLGLYITRLIIEAHGGRIWAESDLGKGSTFAFALPIA